MINDKEIKLFITGNVQGVFFRDNTKKIASELKLKGWVKNTDDGRVKILAQGKEEDLKLLIKWCWNESPGRVDDIIEKWRDINFKKDLIYLNFVIKQ